MQCDGLRSAAYVKRSSCVRLRALPLLAAVLIAAVATGRATASDSPPDTLDPLAVITASSARDLLSVLASDGMEGRRAGTEGARRASEFIAGAFRKAGLLPGGKDGSFFQPVKVPPASLPGADNRLRIRGVKRRFDMTPFKDFVPFGFSPNARAEGDVVFAGYGISAPELGWDDYADIDVKGKIVFVLRHGPGGKFEAVFRTRKHRDLLSFHSKGLEAQKHGGAAFIVVTDPAHLKGRDRLAFLVGGGSTLRIPCVHAVQSVGEALLGVVGDTLESRQDKMERLGRSLPVSIPTLKVEVSTSVRRGKPVCRNVVGLLKGSDPVLSKECIVIGAHYDHLGFGDVGALGGKPGEIFNGADDNGSGTVGVMETARAFGSMPYRPRRSIVFVAFAGEEIGLFGSRAYAADPLFPPSRTASMINLDMIGRMRKGRVTIMGVGSGKEFEAVLNEANREIGLALTLSKAAYAGSDHTSFYTKRIPVVFFFTGIHPDYHRPSDTIEKIDFEGMAKVTQLVYMTAAKLASMDGKPAFVAVKGGGRRGQRGPRLGIVPDFGYKGKGARIAAVSPNSPASAAGLEDGDVVVGFAGKQVKDMGDLLGLLGRTKTGSTVKLAFLRNGKRIETEVHFKK